MHRSHPWRCMSSSEMFGCVCVSCITCALWSGGLESAVDCVVCVSQAKPFFLRVVAESSALKCVIYVIVC